MGFWLFLTPFYLVPFLILFAMKRGSWLAVATLAASGLCWWIWRDVSHADGPGALFALVGAGIITLGFVAGGSARALLLLARGWGQSAGANAIIGLLFFVGFPAAYFGWGKYQMTKAEARREPPSLACRSKLFDVTMGGAAMKIPLIPGISVGSGAKYFPAYPFNLPEHARRFCMVASGEKPALTNLSLQFDRGVATEPSQRQRPLCDQVRPEAWWPWLCRAERAKRPLIEELHLFDADRYDAGKMLAFDADRGAYFAKYVPKANWVHDGRFERLSSGSQTDYRANDWPNAKTPYHANCFTTHAKEQFCRAGYRLTPRLGIVYSFRSKAGGFQKDAVAADKAARILAGSFMVGSEPLSSQ